MDRITASVTRCALALTVLYAANASAFNQLPLGSPLIVQSNGPVMAQFVGGASADFTNELFLNAPANALGLLFENNTTSFGFTKNLGTFAAGTELVFRNHVVQTDNDFFSGPATQNIDGIPHNGVVEFSNNEITAIELGQVPQLQPPPGTQPGTLLRGDGTIPVSLVGFEDQFGGGDLDYNDMRFLLTNVGPTAPVPEPSQTILFLAGLGMIGLLMRRRRT